MSISIKGIFRGLKIIAQIFTSHREHEIEIGYPTDVRHVSHVGFGGASGSCPSWMNEFRGAEEVTVAGGGGGGASMSSAVQSRQTSWASLDFFEQPVGAVELPPAGEATAADISAAHDATCAGTTTPRDAPPPKKPAPRPKKAGRASLPGSSARSSSSWRFAASLASTARTDSDEPRPAGVRAAA